MVGLEIEVLVSVGGFPVYGCFEGAVLLKFDTCVEEGQTAVFLDLTGEFDVRVDGVDVVVETLDRVFVEWSTVTVKVSSTYLYHT